MEDSRKSFSEIRELMKKKSSQLRIIPIQAKCEDWQYGCQIIVKGNKLPYNFCKFCLEAPEPIVKW